MHFDNRQTQRLKRKSVQETFMDIDKAAEIVTDHAKYRAENTVLRKYH